MLTIDARSNILARSCFVIDVERKNVLFDKMAVAETKLENYAVFVYKTGNKEIYFLT